MFACFIAEWREWVGQRMLKTVTASAAVIAAVGVFSFGQPLVMLWAYGVWALWLGWSQGNKYRHGSSAWERAISDAVTARQVMGGKLLASSLMFAAVGLAVSPPLILMGMVWGPPPAAVAVAILHWYPLFLVGLGAGLSSSLTLDGDEGFFGTVFIILWFTLTLLIRPFNPVNPFLQFWRLLSGGAGAGPWISLGATAALAAILLALAMGAVDALRRAKRD